jgi:hypothetical protein
MYTVSVDGSIRVRAGHITRFVSQWRASWDSNDLFEYSTQFEPGTQKELNGKPSNTTTLITTQYPVTSQIWIDGNRVDIAIDGLFCLSKNITKIIITNSDKQNTIKMVQV